MDHKSVLLPNEKMKKLELLRKQRDGRIIGVYRNILADIYEKIEKISVDNNGICSSELLQKMYLPYTSHKKNVILDYCLDLEQLGYIQIMDSGEIIIISDLDF